MEASPVFRRRRRAVAAVVGAVVWVGGLSAAGSAAPALPAIPTAPAAPAVLDEARPAADPHGGQRAAEARQQAEQQAEQQAAEAQQAAPPPAPAAVVIPVVGAGGQAAVDACAGPVRFTPVTVSVSIAEHDLCGGWSRMGWIQPGTTVTVQGFGTFTAVERMVVPRGASEGVLAGFAGGYPPIFLQTCIPGTWEMLLIALR